MSKVYERHWRSLPAIGGQRNCWKLPFPRECNLQKIVVVQVGGSTVPFILDVFNSHRVCNDGSASSGGVGDPEGSYEADPDLYRVVPTFESDSPGRFLKIYDTQGPGFTNMDGGPATNKEHFIYLQINPEGASEDLTYDIALTAIYETMR